MKETKVSKKDALEKYQRMLEEIENPLIRKAMQSRKKNFIFGFLFGDEKTSYGRSHSDYSEHTDKNFYGDYSERFTHTDYQSKGNKHSGHTDKTEHNDYSEYSEYADKHEDNYRDILMDHREYFEHCSEKI